MDRPLSELQKVNEQLTEANKRLGAEIAQRRNSEAALSERLRFEGLLSEVSARLVNLPAERLDAEIDLALKMILEFFQVDRCGLLRLLPDRTSWRVTHVAFTEDVPPVPTRVDLPIALFPFAYDTLIRRKAVFSFATRDELPAEAITDLQTAMAWGVRSTLNIPILVGDSVDHIIALNSIKRERSWPAEIIPRVQLLGEIFVNALERRGVELALRESEERLNLAAASAEAGLWGMVADTGHIWATDKLRDLFQFSRGEELSFERFLEVVHPEDRTCVRESARQCLEKKEMVRIEYRVLYPDGSCRWIVSRGRSFPSAPDKPERLMGVSIDVTARKEMEHRLREQLEEIDRLKLQLEQENTCLREEIMLQHRHDEIVGRSAAMKQVLAQVEQVAGTEATVLLQGETGTGKELLARTIHRLSRRRERPLVTINCAALPPTLIETELFGREKGAYTGAMTRMAGRFEVADRSTLFLDEIGELPLELQAKLLRVLEEGRFERLGSTKPLQGDVRIIAATNRDLSREVEAGRFRKDLYYRLSVFPISIPPLRERPEDVPPLVWAFVKQHEGKLGRRIDRIPARCMESLQRYPWPGNARELRNIVEHAMIVCSGETLHLDPPHRPAGDTPADDRLEEVERRHILGVLAKTGWRVTGQGGAAEMLGMKRTTLQSRMKKLGIRRPPHNAEI